MRIGIGYDIHPLKAGRKLILGGVEIPFEKGLLGHSDADALFHAIGDALLGALGAGDMGDHFPDTDPRFQGQSSSFFLQEILKKVKKAGYVVHHLDSNVILEKPKLGPYKEEMVANISKLLKVSRDRVNVKAKRNEGLGSLGRGEGIAAQAVVLLRPK
ncbi:MAG: 2-C-methyl-D-erythritol 2,4-cyclodiphosphate synthase [Deltaproteobacteria bacterium]|nr:2-C-methyl-D-erythritol 2,4-cyclodiphosphate synthase [Deltaproteobacteria bacterium]